MFGLNHLQREAIGLAFVLERLTPDSPYGIEKKKEMAPLGLSDRKALDDCFHNIERAILVIGNDGAGFDECRRLLMSFRNIRGIIRKCETSWLHEVELFEVKAFLLLLEKLAQVFAETERTANFADISFVKMDAALSVLDPEGKRMAPFSIDERHSPALAQIRRDKAAVEARLRKLGNRTGDGEWNDANNRRILLAQQEEAEETQVMKRLSAELSRYAGDFYHNMETIGTLDLAIAKALLAMRFGGVRPRINDGECVLLEEMSNPYVAESLERDGKSFAKTSIRIRRGVTVITGANMGGKSVAMQSALLNVALCRLGLFVFARNAEIPLFDGIRFIGGDLQDTNRGLSTFGAELSTFKEISSRLKTEFLFVALDEFAKGTNPEEGAAIARAVAAHLASSGSICLMTTHYDNVATPEFPHYRVAGLTEAAYDLLKAKMSAAGDAAGQGIDASRGIDAIAAHMDYTLAEVSGRAAPPRDALNICRLIGLDEDIIRRIECGLIDNRSPSLPAEMAGGDGISPPRQSNSECQ